MQTANPLNGAAPDTATKNDSGGAAFFFAMSVVSRCSVFAFACWTVACHLCVFLHLTFIALGRVGTPALLGGIVLGIISARKSGRSRKPQPTARPALPGEPRWIPVGLAGLIVATHTLGIGYSVFWILSAALLLSALWLEVRSYQQPETEERGIVSTLDKVILFLLLAASPVVTYFLHSPKIDDAVYVGTAADAVAHPELPVLSHDVIYGDQKFPLMLPSYAVESYELLIGFLARVLRLEPILVGHALVPTALSLLIPISWAMLMRILAPRYWSIATALAVIALAFHSDPRGFDQFSFAGLFFGKSILVSIGIPLLFAFAWEFEQSGAIWDWLAFTAATIGCVGVSSSAIFIAPIALTAAAFAGASENAIKRASLVLLPALYPLTCGLAISHGFGPLDQVFAYLPARASLAATMVFGKYGQNLILFMLLAAPFVAWTRALRRKLLFLVLMYFLVSLNPFTFKFLSRFTTRDAVWRLLWCVPVAAIVATAAIGVVRAVNVRWGKWATVIAVLVLANGAFHLLRHSQLISAQYSSHPLKVVTKDYSAARDAIAATPPNSYLLAPENVAVWVPTFVHRVPLISVREIYDQEMGAHLSRKDAETRRELRELTSGEAFAPEHQRELVNELSAYSVGLVVTTEDAARNLSPQLTLLGYSRFNEEWGYVFFRRNAG